jgi:hypothetical protein
MSTEITVYNEARAELQEILDAGAKSLKRPGLELMPVKRDMLRGLSDIDRDLVLDTLNLLFAACLAYEGAQWSIRTAANPLELVTARIEAGRARGVIESLFFGPTVNIISTAMHLAPIAFYALAMSAPDLRIIDRLTGPSKDYLKGHS